MSLNSASLTGTVTKKSQGIYTVRTAERSLPCALSSRLRKVLLYPTAAPTSLPHRVRAVKDIQATDPVAVGDRVQLTDAGDGAGLITEVLPRSSALTRRAAADHGAGGRTASGGFRQQVIVANADQVVAEVAIASPLLKWKLLDRYLTAAELAGLPTLICLTNTWAKPIQKPGWTGWLSRCGARLRLLRALRRVQPPAPACARPVGAACGLTLSGHGDMELLCVSVSLCPKSLTRQDVENSETPFR